MEYSAQIKKGDAPHRYIPHSLFIYSICYYCCCSALYSFSKFRL